MDAQRNTGLFNTIRQSFKEVAAQARHVRIRHDGIEAYAYALQRLPQEQVYDSTHHFIGTPEQTAAFVLIMDSINFGGTFKKDLAKEDFPLEEDSLYFTMAKKLKRIFETQGGLSAEKLTNLQALEFAELFGLGNGPVGTALARLYSRSLRELGEFIRDRHEGRFIGVIEKAQNSAEKVVEELSLLQSFNDVADYHGIRVPLLKRAQITAADLHLAFQQSGTTLLNDIDRLTAFPDNAVAHVLHEDGILEYSAALERKIAAGEELQPGSDEEVEIRACTGHAVELIRQFRPDLSSMNIDHILWHRSHEPEYLKRNHHKVMTMFY